MPHTMRRTCHWTSAQWASFFLTWPLIILRVALLVGPPTLVVLTIGDDSLAALTLVRIWAPQMAKALAMRRTSMGVTPDMLLLLLTTLKTMRVLLDFAPDPGWDPFWLLPLEVGALYITLAHLTREVDVVHKGRSGYRHSWLIAMLVVIVAATGALLWREIDTAATWASILITVSLLAWQCALGVSLVAYVWKFHSTREKKAWLGGSLILLQYLYLEVSTVFLDDWPHNYIHLGTAVLVGIFSILAVVDERPYVDKWWKRAAKEAYNLVAAVFECAFLVVSSVAPYQIAAMASACIVVHTTNAVWYTSVTTFPPDVERPCGDILGVIDTYLRPFFEFTSDPDFQTTLEVTMPEIAGVRVFLNKLLFVAYSPLTKCHTGVSHTTQPINDLFLLGTIGFLCVTCIAALAQVFPRGQALAQSKWFWAISALGGILNLVATHLLSDAVPIFWFSLFEGSTYERTYTDVGFVALYSQAVFTACCIALFVCLSLERNEQVGVQTGGAFKYTAMKKVSTNRKCTERLNKAGLYVWNYIKQPSLVLFLLTGLFLAYVIVCKGSPISNIGVVKRTSDYPPWADLTTADRVIVSIGSLEKLLLGSAERSALTGVALVEYILKKFGCLACICIDVPSLSQIEGVVGTIGDGFSHAFGRNALNVTNAAQSLLASSIASDASGQSARTPIIPSCDRPSCDLTQICILDLLSKGIEDLSMLVTKGLLIALKFVADEIISIIPSAKILEDALGKVDEILKFEDFNLLALVPTFHIDFGKFGVVPAFRHPVIMQFSTKQYIIFAAILAASVVFLVATGIASAAIQSAILSLEIVIVSSTVSFVVSLVVLEASLRLLLRQEGYDLVITYAPCLYLYAIVLACLTLCACLRASESSVD
jgi:hypothetical protein